MRSWVIGLTAALLLSVGAASLATGQDYDIKAERHMLKRRQKEEWKNLKLAQKFRKQSLKGVDISKGARLQIKHEMERQERALKEKQRNEAQELQDRQRMLKDAQNAYSAY